MFKYIFGIEWKEYKKYHFDKQNFLIIFVSLAIIISLGYIKYGILGAFIAFILWAIFIKLFLMGGAIIF